MYLNYSELIRDFPDINNPYRLEKTGRVNRGTGKNEFRCFLSICPCIPAGTMQSHPPASQGAVLSLSSYTVARDAGVNKGEVFRRAYENFSNQARMRRSKSQAKGSFHEE
jgi:hypothetical protein